MLVICERIVVASHYYSFGWGNRRWNWESFWETFMASSTNYQLVRRSVDNITSVVATVVKATAIAKTLLVGNTFCEVYLVP